MGLLRIAGCLLSFSLVVHADATRNDWIGEYEMNHDGHVGRLFLFAGKMPPGMGLQVRYTDDKGSTYPGRANEVDDNGQHLRFTIDFPGNPQVFDVYIFSFDKTKLAGTTVWGGRTFGVYASKLGASAAAGTTTGQPKRSVLPNGEVEVRYPDGTVRTRPIRGGCGWNIRYPDGRTKNATCMFDAVIPLIPPDPPSDSQQGKWLNSQNGQMLAILQGLLGGPGSSDFANYIQAYETPLDPSIYKQIYYRTQAIENITSAPE